jgi:hypothetical protein
VKPRAYATGETTNRESPIGRHIPHREMTIRARYLVPLIGPPNSHQPLPPRVGASGADRRTICPHFNEWIFYLSVINLNIPKPLPHPLRRTAQLQPKPILNQRRPKLSQQCFITIVVTHSKMCSSSWCFYLHRSRRTSRTSTNAASTTLRWCNTD